MKINNKRLRNVFVDLNPDNTDIINEKIVIQLKGKKFDFDY